MHGKEQGGTSTGMKENGGLFLEFEARAMELVGGGAQSLGNVLVRGEALQVDGVKNRQHVEADIERSLGIVDEIANDRIVFAEIAIVGDESKDFIGEAGHRSEGLDLPIRQPWGLQYRALDDLVVV